VTLPADLPGADKAVALTRELFLRDDNYYGCAETSLVALQQVYGLPDAADSSAAMVLNGGVAYSGGICGAVSGAAMAVGKLAGERISDHRQAKRTARRIIQLLMIEFEQEFGSHRCSDLIDYEISIPSEHDAFIESGVWRKTCIKQLEFSVSRLQALADQDVWNTVISSLDANPSE
jgi:C_GCAxxG_C_C family probable redox protein